MSSTHDANAAGRKLLAKIPISVRWRDMDSMGHVNNAKYISYLEEARVRWMLTVPDVSMTDRIAPVPLAARLRYGCTWVNTHFMLTNEMPHGGFRQSGYGKDLSLGAVEDYTVARHVMVKWG